ncbi:hypothetical protein Prudu_293S000200 [Prunus dulcis]|uniref:Reverse transcriptase domain-containing protein n=1 Tax=Prunus dulcis TaxID=3755 RepID=A0A5H2XMH9_PRUDU|nr:hypothetical protein Prudu_293S000200 [Prunus dulcis]
MEIVEADPRPFLPSAMCLEARYYHDDLGPFTFFGVNQNGRPHGVTAQRLIEEGLANSMEDWNRPFYAKTLMISPNQLDKDRAATIRSITKRLLIYWEERKFFTQNPATNMAEFTHESTKEQEEEVLQEEVLDFAPAALDDSLPEVEDPLQEINLGTEEDPRPTFISTLLEEPLKSELIALLQEFRDCFAWHYHEMPGLDRQLVEHKLPIKDGYLPVKQARRRMSMDTELKVKEEIERLLKAGFIRPAIYADWLANIVPVLKRKTGAVRICVDYRNLNEASPKDEYPMPMADMLIDGAAHNQMLSFMDGNAGYNQIMMAEQDIHKTAFMCPGHIGAFEYTVMPFGLRTRCYLSKGNEFHLS